MKIFKFVLALSILILSQVQSADYSQNGKNWLDTTCKSGTKQSPININPSTVSQNNRVKFTVNYEAIQNGTLQLIENRTKFYVNYNYSGNTLELWNERGEYRLFHLDYFQWKIKSEHTLDNRQYSAELQLHHKQYATNKKVVVSILFDEEIYLMNNKQKTCFVDSFKFDSYKTKVGSLEIPLLEYLQYIPQDFYYYYRSITEPPCNETVTWIVMKSPQPITTSQVNSLKSQVNATSGNYRSIQSAVDRTVYLSGAKLGSTIIHSNAIMLSQNVLIYILASALFIYTVIY